LSDPFSYLFALGQFGIKFGLDNISAIVERLGHPERSFQSVHIAGTNGKGSVTAMVDAALRAAGRRSARYTSPHLLDLTERFVVAGQPVEREALRRALADVRDVVDALRRDGVMPSQPTFFEVTTAVAFELFRRAGVETAVLEVGLGGRLDATNVVSPAVTAITSIAFDHQTYLGSTLGQIAAEKAGILKPGVPMIVGSVDDEASRAIEEAARTRGAPLVAARAGVVAAVGDADGFPRVRLRTPVRDYGTVVLGLRGGHQVENAIVAVRVLETLDSLGAAIPAEAIVRGLEAPDWPGRLDVRRLSEGREVLLDAAHNPAGAAALASYVEKWSSVPLPLVFGVMRDKDVEGMLRHLLPTVGPVIITAASNPRSSRPEIVADALRRIAPHHTAVVAPTPREALSIAWRDASRIIVAGSIFLLADVINELGD
jgi:dihydrofolate synthase/folylpolyglutamate synthase